MEELTYCRLCGEKVELDGKCPNSHEFKKMCINCAFIGETAADDVSEKKSLVCMNEENRKEALNKMLKILEENGGGYTVKNLEIEPVPLKKPTLKCGKWCLSEEVKEEVLALFK